MLQLSLSFIHTTKKTTWDLYSNMLDYWVNHNLQFINDQAYFQVFIQLTQDYFLLNIVTSNNLSFVKVTPWMEASQARLSHLLCWVKLGSWRQ